MDHGNSLQNAKVEQYLRREFGSLLPSDGSILLQPYTLTRTAFGQRLSFSFNLPDPDNNDDNCSMWNMKSDFVIPDTTSSQRQELVFYFRAMKKLQTAFGRGTRSLVSRSQPEKAAYV